jgi:hypothetical protein
VYVIWNNGIETKNTLLPVDHDRAIGSAIGEGNEGGSDRIISQDDDGLGFIWDGLFSVDSLNLEHTSGSCKGQISGFDGTDL